MDTLDQAVETPQAPLRPNEDVDLLPHGFEGPGADVVHDDAAGSAQIIMRGPPRLPRQNAGDGPAADRAQPNGIASPAAPLTAAVILARLEQHARHAQGALAPEPSGPCARRRWPSPTGPRPKGLSASPLHRKRWLPMWTRSRYKGESLPPSDRPSGPLPPCTAPPACPTHPRQNP